MFSDILNIARFLGAIRDNESNLLILEVPMASRISNVLNARSRASSASATTADSGVVSVSSGKKKEKKSCWREIERLKSKLKLLKALKEIDPDFDPYSSQEYMEF